MGSFLLWLEQPDLTTSAGFQPYLTPEIGRGGTEDKTTVPFLMRQSTTTSAFKTYSFKKKKLPKKSSN